MNIFLLILNNIIRLQLYRLQSDGIRPDTCGRGLCYTFSLNVIKQGVSKKKKTHFPLLGRNIKKN